MFEGEKLNAIDFYWCMRIEIGKHEYSNQIRELQKKKITLRKIGLKKMQNFHDKSNKKLLIITGNKHLGNDIRKMNNVSNRMSYVHRIMEMTFTFKAFKV